MMMNLGFCNLECKKNEEEDYSQQCVDDCV